MNWIIDLSRVPLRRKNGPWENGISLRLSPQICLKHRTPNCRDRVILRMRTWKCVRQNNALISSSMVPALGPYWLPNSYNSKDISKLSHST